jgi:hypothetical protein
MMNRRFFLSCIVAAASVAGFALEPRKRGAIIITKIKVSNCGGPEATPSHAVVEGHPDDVKEFVELFQTNLWPEWRTHDNPLARQQMAKCAEHHATGKGAVSLRGRECLEAFGKTVSQWLQLVRQG